MPFARGFPAHGGAAGGDADRACRVASEGGFQTAGHLDELVLRAFTLAIDYQGVDAWFAKESGGGDGGGDL